MTLREVLGPDVQRLHEQLDALLDREDVVLAFFNGSRVVTYAHGFGVAPSQLELLGVELERTLRAAVGRRAANRAGKRRSHDGNQRDRTGDGVDRDGHGALGRVLRLASKIA
jgi:hypothetical protein